MRILRCVVCVPVRIMHDTRNAPKQNWPKELCRPVIPSRCVFARLSCFIIIIFVFRATASLPCRRLPPFYFILCVCVIHSLSLSIIAFGNLLSPRITFNSKCIRIFLWLLCSLVLPFTHPFRPHTHIGCYILPNAKRIGMRGCRCRVTVFGSSFYFWFCSPWLVNRYFCHFGCLLLLYVSLCVCVWL